MGSFYEQVKERMMRYARINTQSARFSGNWPTSACQYDLARELYEELKSIGADDVFFDEDACVVYAKIPASEGYSGEPLGLIAHMDTAPDASGENVRPWVLENYDGSDIILNKEKNIVMRAADYDNLSLYIGQDLILTDGTTLLGGDDKASIAAIMTMAGHLCSDPLIPHRQICIAFTPDEEVGGLARGLDLSRFGAKSAYTLDGDHLGWYQDATFNASEAVITIHGLSVHTGTAKGIMINASDIACEFAGMLPPAEKPQYTDGTDGFYHIVSVVSSCENAEVTLIIRDFDAASFRERETFVRECAEKLNLKYGDGTVSLKITGQYRNMNEIIKNSPHLVENLRRAITECGLTPRCEPFRGGTDGSALSFRGLPCPNLSAGYENAHGRFEYVPVQSMEKNVEILLRLCQM